ncbi:MAG: sulfurtransferase TusA family protein [Planctomycetes bacterium]|nr:sulfurtransferase TusA family protein [Planctomycetota bacterium]
MFGAAATGVAGAATAPTTTTAPAADADWDAGDLGCGDLVLELRFRLRELSPGSVLHVTARDPAAPVDLPAWCGLCGHTLRHASHPDYWIEKKRD